MTRPDDDGVDAQQEPRGLALLLADDKGGVAGGSEADALSAAALAAAHGALQDGVGVIAQRMEVSAEALGEESLERELRYVLGAAGRPVGAGHADGDAGEWLSLVRRAKQGASAWPDFAMIQDAIDAHLEHLGADESCGEVGGSGQLAGPAAALANPTSGEKGAEAGAQEAAPGGDGDVTMAPSEEQVEPGGADEQDSAAPAHGSAPAQVPPGGAGAPGRFGILTPEGTRVRMEARSLSGRITFERSGRLESLSNFSSARANSCVYGGSWMYEITLGTSGIQQIGWATLSCPFTNEEGVGDAPNSFAYDGKRVRKWSVESSAYGQQWAKGDVIGCMIDLDAGEISYARNGVDMGVAFTGVKGFESGLAYFPALSLSHGEKCDVNFGDRPFLYPIDGFTPMQLPPPVADLKRGRYLADTLGRIMRASRGGGGGAGPDAPSPSSRGALGESHALLLCRTVCERLLPLVAASDYLVADAVLPMILGMLEPGCPQQLAEVEREVAAGGTTSALNDPSLGTHLVAHCINSIGATGEQSDVHKLLRALFDTVALRARSSLAFPIAEGAPTSSTFVALALAIARSDAAMDAWSVMPEFYGHMEGLLAMKAPNESDLQVILPATAMPPRRADSKHVSAWMDGVAGPLKPHQALNNDLKVALLRRVLVFKPPGQAVRGRRLFNFVESIVRKNRGATRNVPPPGLTDPTVLVSLYFALLQLMQPLLKSKLPLKWKPSNLLPRYADDLDYPRIGGALGHLRKHAVASEEQMRSMPAIEVFGATAEAQLAAANGALTGRLVKGVRDPDEDEDGAAGDRDGDQGEGEEMATDIDRPRFPGAGPAAGPAEGSDASQGLTGAVAGRENSAKLTDSRTPLELVHGREDATPADFTVDESFELLDAVIVLYHIAVCQGFKQASWFHAQQQASVANLSETERSLDEREAVAAREAERSAEAMESEGAQGGDEGVAAADSPGTGGAVSSGDTAGSSEGNHLAGGGDLDSSGSGRADGVAARPPAPTPSMTAAESALEDLRRARDALRDDAIASVRAAAYQRVTLQSSHMQTNVLAITGLIARLLISLSSRSDLWAWVPECYIETLLDAFHAMRRSDPTCMAAFSTKDTTVASIVTFLTIHADDRRIINPDVRDIVLQSASVLLQYSDYLAAFQESQIGKSHMMRALFACFDQRFWIPAANIMLRLSRARGFHPKYSRSQQYAGSGHIYRCSMRAELAKSEVCKVFMDRALNTLNWTVSEFHMSMKELADARANSAQSDFPQVLLGGRAPQGADGGGAGAGVARTGGGGPGIAVGAARAGAAGAAAPPPSMLSPQQNQMMRKCNIMYELSVNLLCLLEVISIECPRVLLGGNGGTQGSALSLGRLAEVLAFVLTLTTAGKGAALFNDTLAQRAPQLSKISRTGILGPVTSILVTLHMAARHFKSAETPAEALATSRGDAILPCIEYLQGLSANTSSMSTNPEHVHRTELIGLHAAVQASLDLNAEPDEAPDEFVDPICSEIMRDPVKLPSSGVVCERSVIERHLLTDSSDPFNRSELTLDMLVPQAELKARIDDWLSEERTRRSSLKEEAASAKATAATLTQTAGAAKETTDKSPAAVEEQLMSDAEEVARSEAAMMDVDD